MGEVLSEGVCDWGASGALVCPESARQPLTPLFRLGLYILSILTTTCVSNGKGLLLHKWELDWCDRSKRPHCLQSHSPSHAGCFSCPRIFNTNEERVVADSIASTESSAIRAPAEACIIWFTISPAQN